jgi:exopolysaccharide production protein ExoQ
MLQYATDIEENEYREPRVHKIFPFIANFSFILYIFFSFFGTALPFREKVFEVDDIGTSNIVNQIAFTTLFFLSVFSMLPKAKTAMAILWKEKIFSIFIIWCILSVIWSDYSFVSLKRVFQFLTAFMVVLAAMVHVDYSEIMLKKLKYLFFLYVLVSVVSIAVIPGAKDYYGIWRGIAPSKNHLGQASLLTSLILFYSVWTERGFKRIITTFIFLLSVALLFGSQSVTSISTFLLITFLGAMFYLDRYVRNFSIGRLLVGMTILGGVAFFFLVVFLAPDILAALAGSAGKDLTFTGRTDLWTDVLYETEKHWVLGAGYQGFWVVDNPHLLALYEIYVWLPNQAHNGYIDILNELGVVGLGMFLMIIINYFINLTRYNLPHYWKWFVLAAIIINFQESTFIRPQVVTGVLFMFSYMALFSDIYKMNKYETENSVEIETEEVSTIDE